MKIALLLVGYGNVARRFVQLLDELHPHLAARGVEPMIVGVMTRRHGRVFDSAGLDAARVAHNIAKGDAVGPASVPSALEWCAQLRSQSVETHVLVETTTLDIRSGRAGNFSCPRGVRGRGARDHRQQGTGRVRLPGARRRGGRARRVVPLRRRRHGRHPDLQPGARDDAWRHDRGISRRREQHHELHLRLRSSRASRSTPRWRACRRRASPRPTRRSTWTGGTRRPRRPRSRTCWLGGGHDAAARRARRDRRRRARSRAGRTRGRAPAEAGGAPVPDAELTRCVRVGLEELPADDPLAMLDGQANALELDTLAARPHRHHPARRRTGEDGVRAAVAISSRWRSDTGSRGDRRAALRDSPSSICRASCPVPTARCSPPTWARG